MGSPWRYRSPQELYRRRRLALPRRFSAPAMTMSPIRKHPLFAIETEGPSSLGKHPKHPEFLMAIRTDNLFFLDGKTSNPVELRTPRAAQRGESGGDLPQDARRAELAATAAAPFACPRIFWGICGLKPTPGRIPATGHSATEPEFSWTACRAPIGPHNRGCAFASSK